MRNSAIAGLFFAGMSIAVCFMLPAVCVFQATPSVAAAKAIEWNESQIRWHSFDDGMREAQATGKPILAIFYADWCPHCVAYSRLFHALEIVRLSQHWVMVKVDCDRNPEINKRYAPDGGYLPRTIVLRPDGSLVASLGGTNARYRYFIDYRSTNELASLMNRAITMQQ